MTIKLEQLDSWYCMECEEKFYLSKDKMPKVSFLVYCPYCGNWDFTVCKTMKE